MARAGVAQRRRGGVILIRPDGSFSSPIDAVYERRHFQEDPMRGDFSLRTIGWVLLAMAALMALSEKRAEAQSTE